MSQPIEERGEKILKCIKNKKTIKQNKKNLHKHSLYIRKEIELKQRGVSLPIKYLRFYSKK